MQPISDDPEPRVLRNLYLLATELPGELRELAADAAAFATDPARRFNRAQEVGNNFLVGKNGGSYQKHQPGLSFLMFPAYALDRRIGGVSEGQRWPLRLHAVNAFFLTAYLLWTLAVFRLLRRLDHPPRIAWIAALAVGLTMPTAAFAFQWYPESAAGILVLLVVTHLLQPGPAPAPRWSTACSPATFRGST